MSNCQEAEVCSCFYKVLMVEKPATGESLNTRTIIHNYRKLMLNIHPDRNLDRFRIVELTDACCLLNKAIATLSNDQKEVDYRVNGPDRIPQQSHNCKLAGAIINFLKKHYWHKISAQSPESQEKFATSDSSSIIQQDDVNTNMTLPFTQSDNEDTVNSKFEQLIVALIDRQSCDSRLELFTQSLTSLTQSKKVALPDRTDRSTRLKSTELITVDFDDDDVVSHCGEDEDDDDEIDEDDYDDKGDHLAYNESGTQDIEQEVDINDSDLIDSAHDSQPGINIDVGRPFECLKHGGECLDKHKYRYRPRSTYAYNCRRSKRLISEYSISCVTQHKFRAENKQVPFFKVRWASGPIPSTWVRGTDVLSDVRTKNSLRAYLENLGCKSYSSLLSRYSELKAFCDA